MKVALAILALVAHSSPRVAIAVDEDDLQRGLRGPKLNFNGRGVGGRGVGGGRGGDWRDPDNWGGRWDGGRWDGGRWDGRDDGGDDSGLTGQVVVRLKTVKELGRSKPGKSNGWRRQRRDKMMNRLRKRARVVFESRGDMGYEVFNVGKGKEKAFIDKILGEDEEGIIQFAEENSLVYPNVVPNAPNEGTQYNSQFHHVIMQSELAWNVTQGLSNITVAICDTGLEADHPDLEANRLEGYHAPSQTWEYAGGDVSNVHPHGTNCAGCAAAIGNNGVGVAGVGWNFKHRVGRVTDSPQGGATPAVLADCARRMCELDDVKVVNLSYGGAGGQLRKDAATYCKTHGALLVNAAGNDNSDLSQFGEADDNDIIVVGASDPDDSPSGFSAYGRYVDVWAPGSGVWTTTTNGGWAPVAGTSFSAPLVAGVIALIWSVNPALAPNEVESILKASAEDVGGIMEAKNSPYGRVNSFRAVQLAAGVETMPPTTSPTQSPTSSPCTGIELEVAVLTDNYSGETTWTLVNNCPGGGSWSGGPWDTMGLYVEVICATDDEYTFTINDSYGDGICCDYGDGSYSVQRMGVELASGGSFGASESTTFGTCGGGGGGEPPVTPEPTNGPTPEPTNGPTPEPTNGRTPMPTTPMPTNGPTPEPTNGPTPEPTNGPTPEPTNGPTPEPTNAPTPEPTNAPTPEPTNAPTPEPTNAPTPEPTTGPITTTAQPSKDIPDPTNAPTPEPTNGPTPEPTNAPTPDPTNAPTPDPTNAPTPDPTNAPTPEPTNGPTLEPTNSPVTAQPTSEPTPQPTSEPTPQPTGSPVTPPPTEPPAPPSKMFVACGYAGNTKCNKPVMEAYLHETHDVRCCSEVKLASGWKSPNSCPIWGESDIDQNCWRERTYEFAEAKCRQVGARLCTLDEMLMDCTKGTGCSMDRELVWTSTPVPACADDASCGDGNLCTINTCVAGVCQSETVPECATHSIVGGSSAGNYAFPQVKSSGSEELHPVRCCSDTPRNRWKKHQSCDIWGSSPGCEMDKTLAEAVDICAAADGRLCTEEEILNDCTRGSGCGFDHYHVWTSSTYTGEVQSVQSFASTITDPSTPVFTETSSTFYIDEESVQSVQSAADAYPWGSR